jgi:hypothetical protein
MAGTSLHVDNATAGANTGLTLDSSGHVGIGGTPTAPLHVFGGGILGASSTNPIAFTGSGSTLAGIGSYNANTDFNVYTAGTGVFKVRTGAVWNSTGALTGTGTERMRIDASGSIASQYGTGTGYSQTGGYGGMYYQNDTGSIGGALILTTSADRGWANVYLNKFDWSAGDDARLLQLSVNGGVVGTISTTGSGTAYNTSSDYRLKENVVELTGATERLKQLNPSRFNFIVDADTTVDGFLAHEVQNVVPEAITGTKDAMKDEEYEVTAAIEEVRDEDGNITTEAVEAVMGTRSVPDMQGIDQSKLVPLLTAALQEAITKIELLTTRIAALEE